MLGELEALAAERDAADRQHEVALSKALSECQENVVWRDSLMREREGLLMLVKKGRDDAQAMQDELGRLRGPCWSCGESPLAVTSPVPTPPREPSPPRRALSPRPIPGHLRPSAASSSAHGMKGQGESAAASSGCGASPEHAGCFCAVFMRSLKCCDELAYSAVLPVFLELVLVYSALPLPHHHPHPLRGVASPLHSRRGMHQPAVPASRSSRRAIAGKL